MLISTATSNITKISSLLSIYNPRSAMKYCSATLVPSITEFEISTSKTFQTPLTFAHDLILSGEGKLDTKVNFLLVYQITVTEYNTVSLHYLKLHFHNNYKKHYSHFQWHCSETTTHTGRHSWMTHLRKPKIQSRIKFRWHHSWTHHLFGQFQTHEENMNESCNHPTWMSEKNYAH